MNTVIHVFRLLRDKRPFHFYKLLIYLVISVMTHRVILFSDSAYNTIKNIFRVLCDVKYHCPSLRFWCLSRADRSLLHQISPFLQLFYHCCEIANVKLDIPNIKSVSRSFHFGPIISNKIQIANWAIIKRSIFVQVAPKIAYHSH